jgi:RNA recognition motif-containing protein
MQSPGPEQPQEVANSNVYVSGLPLTITVRRFRQLFDPFGTITGARLIPRRKGYSPVGFVQYTEMAMAHRAIAAMNNAVVDGFTLGVSLAKRDKGKARHTFPQSTASPGQPPLTSPQPPAPAHSLGVLAVPTIHGESSGSYSESQSSISVSPAFGHPRPAPAPSSTGPDSPDDMDALASYVAQVVELYGSRWDSEVANKIRAPGPPPA